MNCYIQWMKKQPPTMLYIHLIQLFKLFNNNEPPLDWLSLNFDQSVNRRQTHYKIVKAHNFKTENNILSTHLSTLNGKINLDWANLSTSSFKIKCKHCQMVQKQCFLMGGQMSNRWNTLSWCRWWGLEHIKCKTNTNLKQFFNTAHWNPLTMTIKAHPVYVIRYVD